MKALPLFILGLLSSAYLQANSLNLDTIDLDKARAYQAYVMTFEWPQSASSEDVEYQDIFSLEGLNRFAVNSGASAPSSVPNPFAKFQRTFANRTKVLSNNSWTLIFPDTGASISERFQSDAQENGYATFTGQVTFTLNRYLESNLRYQHYQFGQPAVAQSTEPPSQYPASGSTEAPQATYALQQSNWDGPTQVLSLRFRNKTASQKLNYVDHPIIGTLIYFEPLDLEQAIDLVSER
ncbi:hypothetical protein MAQ5080_01630 [Marinomonas aquimarina]|uniref:Peptidoglycan-binding protein CsiV n=1 Tax=Marinomonas aquimarina TaxID=295068 RepID=A0A1A8TBF9_9GAMM|nr:hypothetical protein [Marinomonas aquimarina]SBS30294.1 hypothetical protein MAQ5080_01630 [Marinomonas aquimarina]